MTEPTDRRSVAPYDAAVAALIDAEPSGTAPRLLLLLGPSSLLTAAGQPSDEGRAIVAACHARGLVTVALAADAAAQRQLAALLAGCEARVLAADSSGEPGSAGRQVKAATGVSCEAMLLFASDSAALRDAARQGMTTVRLGGGPLSAAALRRGLEAHAAKLEDSRGY